MTLRAISNIGYSGGGIGLKSAGILAQSAVPASVTGTTVATVLATINVPAGAVGPNGSLRVTTYWSATNNANNKTIGSSCGGAALLSYTLSNLASIVATNMMFNRGTLNSQVLRTDPRQIASASSAVTTSTVNMGSSQALTITGMLAVGTDTLTLEAYTVEILNP